VKLDLLSELNAERAARRPVIVVTDVASGEQRLVKAADIASDPLRSELSRQLRMGRSGMVEAEARKLFLNVYAPTARLVVIGAVHISQALAPLARSLDYDVTVVDPRTAAAEAIESLQLEPERHEHRDERQHVDVLPQRRHAFRDRDQRAKAGVEAQRVGNDEREQRQHRVREHVERDEQPVVSIYHDAGSAISAAISSPNRDRLNCSA